MSVRSLKGGRYEIREILDQGGMGVVYRCFDTVVRREVALKTIRGTPEKLALEMFYKECKVLAGMSHPNIVEIFDIGELEEPGGAKPYFVMPLLGGTTLEALIRGSGRRLTVERTVEILCQTCRGLQAAHERGLVHRDIKPANIFVLKDDAVKIIDFGVAHIAESQTTTTAKGTLFYMAPEQIERKPPTPLSDIFALGVVAWQTLTGRRPFEGATDTEVANAILNRIPPPASELNPAVNTALSQVIHKAMAKQPWRRFGSAREFAEALQKAARNEALEIFDPERIRPRMERAGRAFEQGDYQFASEILGELEAEGYLDPGITLLRRQIDHAIRRKTVTQLLESARTRMEEEEFPLALQKVQEALELEPHSVDALALKSRIERHRSQRQVDEWLRLARRHLDGFGFAHAREAIQNVLQLDATDSRALELLGEAQRREQECLKLLEEKHKLYEEALNAYERAELSTAMSRLERVLELDRKAPEMTTGRGSTYQQMYNRVRSERDAMMNGYAEARRSLGDGDFDKARGVSEQFLKKYPGQALFQALQFEIEEQRRQQLSAYIVETGRRVEAEVDLDRRVEILREAAGRFPEEEHFQRALRLVRDKRDLVHSIEARARYLEEQGQFADALGQWEILRTIYPQQPGLAFELERVARRRDQQARADAKGRWVEELDRYLASGEHQRALDLLPAAMGEFPADPELAELEKLARQGLERASASLALLEKGKAACDAGRFEEGMGWLRQAYQADSRNPVVRAVLVEVLVRQAREVMEAETARAADMLDAALNLDPGNAPARSLRAQVEDRIREQAVEECVARARQLQAAGDLAGALAEAEGGLRRYPSAPRLGQLQGSLEKAAAEARAGAPLPEPPPASEPAPSAPPPPPSDLRPAARRRSRLPLVAAAALPVLALAAAGVILLLRGPRAVEVPLDVRTAPPGAAVTVNKQPKGQSNCVLHLPEGSYEVQAAMPGYRPAVATLTLRAGVPGVVHLVLEPVGVALRISTDLDPARIWIGDRPPLEFQGGQFVLDRLPEGAHVIRVAGRHGEASFPVQVAPAAPPQVTGPVVAKEIAAVVVANLGGRARVHSSVAAAAAIDGRPAGGIVPEGLDLGDLAPGGHELALGEGKERRSHAIEIGSEPAITVFLNSDRNVGTLVVTAGDGSAQVDGAQVWVDGKLNRRQTKGGRLRIPNLEVGQHTVRVAMEGYIDPPEQQVDIRKGEDRPAVFELRPVPTVSALAVEGALPGAQFLIDGSAAGAIEGDGSFSLGGIKPGDRALELRKEGYRPRVLTRRFAAGETVKLAAAEVALEAIPKPPEPKPVVKAAAPKPAPPRKMGMEGWANPAGWRTDGAWRVHRGGSLVLYQPTPGGASFVFTAMAYKGRKRLGWLARHAGDKDYLLFEMDEKFFYRKQVSNGKTTELAKQPHNLPRQQFLTCTVEVAVAPERLLHRINLDGKWTVLDDWVDKDGKFTQGPFGFVVPGKDEIGLSNFSVTLFP